MGGDFRKRQLTVANAWNVEKRQRAGAIEKAFNASGVWRSGGL